VGDVGGRLLKADGGDVGGRQWIQLRKELLKGRHAPHAPVQVVAGSAAAAAAVVVADVVIHVVVVDVAVRRGRVVPLGRRRPAARYLSGGSLRTSTRTEIGA